MNYIEKNNSWLQNVASKKKTSVTTLTSKIAIATFMNSPCNRMSMALIAVLEGSPKDEDEPRYISMTAPIALPHTRERHRCT